MDCTAPCSGCAASNGAHALRKVASRCSCWNPGVEKFGIVLTVSIAPRSRSCDALDAIAEMRILPSSHVEGGGACRAPCTRRRSMFASSRSMSIWNDISFDTPERPAAARPAR
eukprot:scaffold48_cov311-Pinguiococcus_pyrenoidosus.AAC.43